MRIVSLILSAVLLTGSAGSSVWTGGSQQEKEQRPAEEIMWRKLDPSHRVLDALVLDDFEALEAYSEDLESLGRTGDWFVSDSERYLSKSAEFRRAAAEIGRAARARDTEAATLAYVELTLGCVDFHRTLGGR